LQKAINSFENAIKASEDTRKSHEKYIKDTSAGLIQNFEFTYELAWKTMKDYLEYMGINGIIGSKGTFREAFKAELILNGQTWIDMINDRNLSAHTYYDDTIKNKLIKNIVYMYYNEFLNFEKKMIEISGD
jgi:nucleotidyltransferase substrate binding protein (TIGR01987 family)